MKKIYLAFALFAALSIVSCVENEQIGEGEVNLSENGIAFKFSDVKTKSAESIAPVEVKTGLSIPLGDKSGSRFFLTESVVDLNAYGPATKGAPVYHQNLLSLKEQGYGQINVKTYLEGGAEHADGNATYDSEDREGGTGGWLYLHTYPTSPWPSDPDQSVYFFLNMPATSNASNLTYDSTNGKIDFDYTSATDAKDQKDILFAARTLTKNEYNSNYKTAGAPVTFYHALTGVKFRVGNNNDNDTKTIITKVEFKNLYGSGHGTIDTSTGKVEWTDFSEELSISVGFDNPDYDPDKDNSIDFISGENNTFGDSWYTGGTTAKPYNKNNLNKEDGSLTLWLVPQTFADHDGVTMTITYLIKTPDTPAGVEHTETINLSEVLGTTDDTHTATVWKAGQLRTYTLEPRYVDVEIIDSMDGYVKSDLHVTNTGNVDEYVRMLVIGNWYGWETEEDFESYKSSGSPEPDILVGYKYRGDELEMETKPDYFDANDFGEDKDGYNTLTRAWFRADGTYGEGFDDSFKFGNPSSDSKWEKAHGGYYYPDPIGPGEKMEFEDEAASQSAMTTPLFESYTLQEEWIPVIYIPDPESSLRRPAYGVHLIMEVVVQAISSKDKDGNQFEDYQAAWIDATGNPNYFN